MSVAALKKTGVERVNSRRLSASLTHRRHGYPSGSCVPTELPSVSPSRSKIVQTRRKDNPQIDDPKHIEHRSHARKIPGVWGLAPNEYEKEPQKIKILRFDYGLNLRPSLIGYPAIIAFRVHVQSISSQP